MPLLVRSRSSTSSRAYRGRQILRVILSQTQRRTTRQIARPTLRLSGLATPLHRSRRTARRMRSRSIWLMRGRSGDSGASTVAGDNRPCEAKNDGWGQGDPRYRQLDRSSCFCPGVDGRLTDGTRFRSRPEREQGVRTAEGGPGSRGNPANRGKFPIIWGRTP